MRKNIFDFRFKITGTLVFLYCILALSASMTVYTIIRVDSIVYRQSLNYNSHGAYLYANTRFREGTDLLTDAVRRYVVSDGEQEFMDRYFHEVHDEETGRHRDKAIEMVKDLPINREIKDTLPNAMKTSTNLMNTEYHAMHLIAMKNPKAHDFIHGELKDWLAEREKTPEGRRQLETERKMSPAERNKLAEVLLWGQDYNDHKTRIYSYLRTGLELAAHEAAMRHQLLKKELFHTLALSAASLIALMLSICGLVFYHRYQRERIIELQAEENARMNVQLKEERDKALKAEKARSYFFSTVSHDIRTPLNSIIGFSEMLQLGIDSPEEKGKALDAIITSGQTLLELINDVLDLSKLESGKMELHPVPTDVAALVRKVANSFEVATSRTSVPLHVEIGKIPLLKLDPQRIRQILFNLIGNAVKFTAKGAITVGASYDNGEFRLSVADTGCGISQENIKKLMSPYVQLQEHDSNKGTGLGLAICKQLAIQMKGTLELESAVGRGSTFTLRIPNVQTFSDKESEAYFSEHRAQEKVTHLDDSITKKRILIVDDQRLNQRILQTMLARLGINEVLTAENGRDALDALKNSGNVDIVLTDMTMPVMDGAAMVREIRKSPQFADIPVYVITADVEMQNEYRKLGFDEMLIKPITLDKLKELLGKYSPHRQSDTTGDGGEAKA